jgi:hypothetical protein
LSLGWIDCIFGSLWEGAGFLRSKKTEGECKKTHSPSVKTFGFATFLPEEGKGCYNNSELRITNYELGVSPKKPIYICREATPQLFTIHFSLFTRAALNPNSQNKKRGRKIHHV